MEVHVLCRQQDGCAFSVCPYSGILQPSPLESSCMIWQKSEFFSYIILLISVLKIEFERTKLKLKIVLTMLELFVLLAQVKIAGNFNFYIHHRCL